MTNIEIQTLDAVKSASRDFSKHIASLHDTNKIWEQRRYEIAKDLYVHHDIDEKRAIQWADRLIDELKK